MKNCTNVWRSSTEYLLIQNTYLFHWELVIHPMHVDSALQVQNRNLYTTCKRKHSPHIINTGFYRNFQKASQIETAEEHFHPSILRFYVWY